MVIKKFLIQYIVVSFIICNTFNIKNISSFYYAYVIFKKIKIKIWKCIYTIKFKKNNLLKC